MSTPAASVIQHSPSREIVSLVVPRAAVLSDLPLVRVLDLPDFLAARVNATATSARLKPSARILLLGLVDKLRSSPRLIHGNLVVGLSGSDAETLLDLSKSSCTSARIALVEAGLVARIRDALDLAPWVARIALVQVPDDMPAGHAAASSSSRQPESGLNLLRNVTKTFLRKDSKNSAVEVPREISRSSDQMLLSLGDLHEAVLLSEALTAAVQLQAGQPVQGLSQSALLAVMPLCAETALVGQANAGQLWHRAFARHGASAVLGLVVAVEDPTVRSRGRWFAAFASGGGAFAADIVDVRPNLAGLRLARAASSSAAVAAEAVKLRKNTTAAFVEEARVALVDLEATCGDPDEYRAILGCDRYVKVLVDASGARYLFNTAGNGNASNPLIQKLLERLGHLLNVASHDIRTGDRPHAMSLG